MLRWGCDGGITLAVAAPVADGDTCNWAVNWASYAIDEYECSDSAWDEIIRCNQSTSAGIGSGEGSMLTG